ncbi:acyl-CoA dehydrogenase family protein [Alkanindiges sp. WGS2144]|uniref:acyl-CoA dehydrogenase family protein n=1 Tax=Alkanindiges sp. WGS2144 TaxID=3366808 RepID=UPI00375100F7
MNATTRLNKAQGLGLNLLTRFAASDLIDQLKLRKLIEKTLYQGSKTGFKVLGATSRQFKPATGTGKQRLPGTNKNLFDLSLTDEQQMMRDMLQRFAADVLRPAASQADDQAIFPVDIAAKAQELGLLFYALPDAYGGVASEQAVVSNVLIAEDLGYGDYSLAASILTSLGVANAITRWGSTEVQEKYLPAFASEQPPVATFAVSEATPAFNPNELATHAKQTEQGYQITGEKTLVLLGEQAEFYIVAAQLNGKPKLFIVEQHDSISVRQNLAMGLKAGETVGLRFGNTPALLLTDDDFSYQAFLDLGALSWCALAIGTCQAVKDYCVTYANERTAFGEPISHRQSVAFMIADMAIEIDAMRMLVWNAASLAEAGQPFHREAYLARLLCAEKSMKIGNDGVQIVGGHGYTKEHPVERWYRDLRATAIKHSGLHA